jgi:hypothetical protein
VLSRVRLEPSLVIYSVVDASRPKALIPLPRRMNEIIPLKVVLLQTSVRIEWFLLLSIMPGNSINVANGHQLVVLVIMSPNSPERLCSTYFMG